MDLTPNEEQQMLREASIDWLNGNMPLDAARTRDPGLWGGMAEMGWLDMTLPEMGLDHGSEALVFAELGRFLAPVGAIATAVSRRWAGDTERAALAIPSANGLRLLDPDNTDSALGLWDGKAGTVTLRSAPEARVSLDLTTRQAVLDDAPEPAIINDPRAALHLALLAAAYGVGCGDAARDMAVEYAKIREQFGKPIGSFQGIKHPVADMAVRCAVARSQLYYAACALDADDSDAPFHVAAAKRLADRAALENGRMNIQVHGGIGMTDEAQPHLLLKRAHLLQFVAPVDTGALLA
ncbi:MAG: acyl-CoA dehydrogenase family protein [Blastomonas sp.]